MDAGRAEAHVPQNLLGFPKAVVKKNKEDKKETEGGVYVVASLASNRDTSASIPTLLSYVVSCWLGFIALMQLNSFSCDGDGMADFFLSQILNLYRQIINVHNFGYI